jgi:starch synthase (maltosyl-transferring)
VVSPSAIDPADARKITVWGDLAEIDNANSPDREGLWAYWTAMLQYHLDLGFDGFRCDAAYKVPRRLWEQLIGVARRRNPSVVFAAETLGCRLAEVRQLRGAGFDYLFNSSKWWHFDAAWCLEQHEEFQEVAPSISFPESHDTERLMEETEGMVPVQKQRYAFAALFSEGLLMPLGYEFGFRKALNVVRTTPEDWEETGLDLSSFITEMNRIKTAVPVFGVEGHFAVLTTLDGPTMVLLKSAPGLGSAAVLVNKDWYSPQRMVLPRFGVDLPEPRRLLRPFSEGLPSPWPADGVVHLQPAEVALVVGADRS